MLGRRPKPRPTPSSLASDGQAISSRFPQEGVVAGGDFG
jgi:hypothetical protein